MATVGIGRAAIGGRRIRWPLIVAAFAFVSVTMAGLALVTVHIAYRDRILPGVSVGTVELGGLDRGAARALLEKTYSGLAGGEVMLTGASTSSRFSVGPIGRRLETAAALEAALGVGRGSTPQETARATVQLLIDGGHSISPTVVFDHAALRNVVVDLGASLDRAPVDAQVELGDGGFTVLPAVPGRRLAQQRLLAALRDRLSIAEPVTGSIAVVFDDMLPTVPTAAADSARGVAERFSTAPLVVTLSEERWTAEPELLRTWIRFASSSTGTISPTLDRPSVETWLGGLGRQIDRAAREASFVFRGGRVRAILAKQGRALNVPATAARIDAVLSSVAAGDARPATIALAVDAVAPRLTTADARAWAARMKRVSKWTTYFVPSERNGFGANIRVPARAINGTVVMPGKVFDYWEAVGEVSRRTGFRQGAAIINGRTEPQGAFAGGICTSSTTMFNAAARAGYEILDRRAHFYYIDRYPLGLDATVFKTDGYVQTMAFRNDTPYPLLVRGLAGSTWTSFEIWSVPTGRTVSFSKPIMKNHREATSGVESDPSKPAGYREVVEVPTDGMDTTVTRTVRDRSGAVVHRDTWFSRYRRIDGLIIRGGQPA